MSVGVSVLSVLKTWARELKRDVIALWLAARDGRVPWYAKALAAFVAAYALSPIDFIPDFIPIIGYLDDLILVPLGIAAVVRMIPADIMVDLRRQAALVVNRPQSRAAAIAIVLLWMIASAVMVYFAWRAVTGAHPAV